MSSLFKKSYFQNHNNRINQFSSSSGRTLLSKINADAQKHNFIQLLSQSNQKTEQLGAELRRSQLDTATMKKQAVQAVNLAANTAAAQTSLHFREREFELKQRHKQQQDIQTITLLANVARKQMQNDQINQHLTEIASLKIQLQQQKDKNRQLEAKHAKASLEQLRVHHLSLGRAIASGSQLRGLATAAAEPLLVEAPTTTPPPTPAVPVVTQQQQQDVEQQQQDLVPSRNAASVHIQKIMRSYVSRRACNRMKERKLTLLLYAWAANEIQKFWRGRIGRFQFTRAKWRSQYKRVWRSAHTIQAKWVEYRKKCIGGIQQLESHCDTTAGPK